MQCKKIDLQSARARRGLDRALAGLRGLGFVKINETANLTEMDEKKPPEGGWLG
jgi:hypothetical protein